MSAESGSAIMPIIKSKLAILELTLAEERYSEAVEVLSDLNSKLRIVFKDSKLTSEEISDLTNINKKLLICTQHLQAEQQKIKRGVHEISQVKLDKVSRAYQSK